MPLVLAQHLDGSSGYDDHIGYLYHYSKLNFKIVQPSERFVYYCPEEKDTGQFYFGCGLIGDILLDPENENRRYCELLDYTPFPVPVFSRAKDKKYFETGLKKKPFWRRAVRFISDNAYDSILAETGLERDLFAGEIPVSSISRFIDPVGRVLEFNSIYASASPKQQRRLSQLLEQGTFVGRKLAELHNYTCQLCQQRGFEQKNGRPYIEIHHFIALDKKEPKSLCSENVLVVCPACHRQLHFAKMELHILPGNKLKIILTNFQYIIQRNTMEYLREL